ncbi:MAG: carboxypeptidase-like regulatory domain-containing protein [Acidobacteriota bacterium]
MAVRWLDKYEVDQAYRVFKDSLDYSKVVVDSGLGAFSRPYVSESSGLQRLHIGASFFGTVGGYAWASQHSSSKVPEMTVRAWRGKKLERETETDSHGKYYIGSLPPLTYQLQFVSATHKLVTSVPTEIHPGEYRQVDCVAGQYAVWRGYPNVETRDFTLLMHELTHAWQSQHGKSMFLSGLGCQILDTVEGDAYSFGAGEAWGDYNIEQQASIVATWYGYGCRDFGKLWPYIRDYVRKGKTD